MAIWQTWVQCITRWMTDRPTTADPMLQRGMEGMNRGLSGSEWGRATCLPISDSSNRQAENAPSKGGIDIDPHFPSPFPALPRVAVCVPG